MKLSDLRRLMQILPPDFDPTDSAQLSQVINQIGINPNTLYQELEMDSRFVDAHKDISYNRDHVGLHSHNFYELLCCCNALGVEYLVGDERYRLRRGDIIMLPPGISHRPLFPEKMSEPYERYVIWLNSAFIDHIRQQFPESSDTVDKYRILLRTEDTQWAFLEDLFAGICHLAANTDSEHQMLLVGSTVTLLAHLRRALRDQALGHMHAEKPQLLDRIITYIGKNLSQKLTLADVAKHFYVSESTVSHLFKNLLDISFYRYVTQRRLIAAKSLIENDISLEEVSAQIGFHDYSSFYRAFKSEYGISPKQYRALQLNNRTE